MDRSFGYGIIGCGWVASAHAWGIRSLEDEGVTLTAVADKDLSRATDFADRFRADAVFEDYRDLLAREDIAAVSICLPDFLHQEVAVAAASAGKHVLCEKPLALDLTGADEMVNACQRSHVGLGLVMNHRYAPDNIRARAALRDGALGQVLIGSVLHSSGLTGDPEGTSPWRGRRGRSTGGVLSTQAIHFLDLLLWFLGPVYSVSASVSKLTQQPQDHEDTAAVTLTLKSGALATLVSTSGSPIMDDFTGTRIEVHGSEGWLVLEGDQLRTVQTRTDYSLPDVALPPPPPGAEEIEFGTGHVHEVMDFVRAVRAGRRPPVPAADARHLMAVVEAAYASARECREVHVDDGPPAYSPYSPCAPSLLAPETIWDRDH